MGRAPLVVALVAAIVVLVSSRLILRSRDSKSAVLRIRHCSALARAQARVRSHLLAEGYATRVLIVVLPVRRQRARCGCCRCCRPQRLLRGPGVRPLARPYRCLLVRWSRERSVFFCVDFPFWGQMGVRISQTIQTSTAPATGLRAWNAVSWSALQLSLYGPMRHFPGHPCRCSCSCYLHQCHCG